MNEDANEMTRVDGGARFAVVSSSRLVSQVIGPCITAKGRPAPAPPKEERMSEPRRPGSSKLTAENLHDYIAGRVPDPWPLVRELAQWGCMFEDGEIPACPHNKQLQPGEWCLPCRATAALERREGVGG